MLETREYLHFEESHSVSGLSKFDIIELIRTNQINAYAWCPRQDFVGVRKLNTNTKNSTLGRFKYEGIIKISNVKAITLIEENKKIYVQFALIMEPNLVKNWDKNPPDITYPNNSFTNHIYLESAPISSFYACSEISPQTKAMKPFLDLINGAVYAYSGDSENFENGKKQIGESLQEFDNSVSISSLKIEVRNFRFSKSEVLKLLKSEHIEQSTIENIHEQKKQAISALDEVIIKVAKKSPGRSDHIWNTLRKESKKEIFDRQYDEDGILEEISQTQIIWRNDRTSQEKTISRAGFKNKLSNLKKEHGLK